MPNRFGSHRHSDLSQTGRTDARPQRVLTAIPEVGRRKAGGPLFQVRKQAQRGSVLVLGCTARKWLSGPRSVGLQPPVPCSPCRRKTQGYPRFPQVPLPCGRCPYLVCTHVAVACWVSSGEPCLLQGLFGAEAAVQEEGHHVLQLLRVLLQRDQAARAGSELVLVELGTPHPGETRESSQTPRLTTSPHRAF